MSGYSCFLESVEKNPNSQEYNDPFINLDPNRYRPQHDPEKRKYFDKWPQQAIWIVHAIVVHIDPVKNWGIVKP